MIQWWQPDVALWMADTYARNRGKEIADRFIGTGYNALPNTLTLNARAHIFAGVDQLSVLERRAVAAVWDQLAAERPQVKLLNDPRRVRTRFVLLEQLHAAGLNQFCVHRAADAEHVTQFPVFVRSDRKHNGPLSGLIDSIDPLRQSIRALRARGEDLDDLMIVQYVDARDDDGLYRKFAAFRVGDRIIPSHILAHKHWMVKSEGSERSLSAAEAEARFQSDGKYDDWIWQVFEFANIDYGRLDFGVVRGVPQAWEINLHPTVGRGRSDAKPREQNETTRALEAVRSNFHARLRNAFIELDDQNIPEPAPLVVTVGDELAAALVGQHKAALRRSRWRDFAAKVYHSPALGRPLRWMYRRLLPRR